eukprot:08104.XXX_270669_270776_1 [CDS] Oithona nana genome sequencing.
MVEFHYSQPRNQRIFGGILRLPKASNFLAFCTKII